MSEHVPPSVADLAGSAIDVHDIDPQKAVLGSDADPESDRIYILEEVDGGFRLIEFGLKPGYPEDPEVEPTAEETMHIPEGCVVLLKRLFEVASLRQNEERTGIPIISEELGLTEIGDQLGLLPMDHLVGDT